MQCPQCGRLSPEELNTCRFCGAVFDETKPADDIVPNHHIVYEIDGDTAPKRRNPYKAGILFIVCALAVIAALIFIFANGGGSAYKSAVKGYASGYFNGDFYSSSNNSAIDLRKVYEAQAQSSASDPFSAFGDVFGGMFGMQSGYSSYEEMIAAYMQRSNEIKMQFAAEYGSDYKLNVSIQKAKKLTGANADTVRTKFFSSYDSVIRDGNVGDIWAVNTVIKLKGRPNVRSNYIFYVLKIDGKAYVMTTDSLDPYTIQ